MVTLDVEWTETNTTNGERPRKWEWTFGCQGRCGLFRGGSRGGATIEVGRLPFRPKCRRNLDPWPPISRCRGVLVLTYVISNRRAGKEDHRSCVRTSQPQRFIRHSCASKKCRGSRLPERQRAVHRDPRNDSRLSIGTASDSPQDTV